MHESKRLGNRLIEWKRNIIFGIIYIIDTIGILNT